MDEVKIWAIDNAAKVEELKSKGQMDAEWSFEDTLVNNPDLLMPELTLVGRQMPTEGGALDLLGVDSDGKLAVFELKRGTLSRDAVAQVIDYASDLDDMELDTLANHISERSGEHGIEKVEDFEEWYNQEFGEQGLAALKPLRLFLVGLGADERTERMVTFLAKNSGMDISLMTFHGFEYGDTTLLAKQVRVEGTEDSVSQSSRRYLSTAERRERLQGHVEAYEVPDLFAAIRAMFREQWRGPGEYLGPTALGFYLLEHERTGSGRRAQRAYARIAPVPGKVQVTFYGRAVNLCRDKFDEVKRVIPFETYRGPSDEEGVYEESTFQLGADDWNIHRERLTSLAQAVYEAWLSRDQEPPPHD